MVEPTGQAGPRAAREAPRGGEGRPLRPGALVGLASLFYAALLSAALGWSALSGRALLYASPAGRARGIDWPFDLAAGALAGAGAILVSAAFTRATPWGRELALALGALLGRLPLGACLLLAGMSGVAEEAFFRGALQPRVGLFWASLAFGAAHFAPRRELLLWTLFSVAAGLLLGWLFESTGNLVAPVVAHALINAVNLRVIALRYAAGR